MAQIPQRTISQFKSKLIGGGTRPNLFEVQVNFPDGVDLGIQSDGGPNEFDGDRFRFLCKAASLPASNVGNLEVPFRGRVLKVAGDRTFDTWSVTIINDEDFQLRTAFEIWMNTLSKLNDATGVTNPSSYMTDAYVQQLGRGREVNATRNSRGGSSSELRNYKFYDIFPTEVSAIDLSYDSSDTIEEFQVTFQVQYFTIGNSLQRNRGARGQTLVQ